MHHSLISTFASPCCGLVMAIESRERVDYYFQGELFEGTLACPCGRIFPVKRGVPVLLPLSAGTSEETEPSFRNRRAWDAIWFRTRAAGMGFLSSERMFESEVRLERDSLAGLSVLELGVGSGRYIDFLMQRRPANLLAVDISEEIFETYARHAARWGAKGFCAVRADALHLPFQRAQFDLVLAIRILHHLPEVERRFHDLFSLLRPGGQLHAVIFRLPDGRLARTMLLLLESCKRRLNDSFGLDALYWLSAAPSACIYLAIHALLLPLARLGLKTPLDSLIRFWGEFDYRFLWCPVMFDFFAGPRIEYLDVSRLNDLVGGLTASASSWERQHEAMWSIRIER